MRIFSNLAVSLDGKIAEAANPTKALGTAADRREMKRLRSLADALVVGSRTLSLMPGPVIRTGRPLIHVVLSRSGHLTSHHPLWEDDRVLKIVCVPKTAQSRARTQCRDRALILACGESELDLWAVVQELKKRGIKNLLVEGGGEIIGAFLKENLLQEMFVTWTPWALGSGDSVSLTGSAALRPWVKFQVLRAKKVKDEVYFHLKVRGARRV